KKLAKKLRKEESEGSVGGEFDQPENGEGNANNTNADNVVGENNDVDAKLDKKAKKKEKKEKKKEKKKAKEAEKRMAQAAAVDNPENLAADAGLGQIESKEAQIERVSLWLQASANSVSRYLVPSQLAHYA